MAINGKVTIDLNKRSIGPVGLLWNRMTPTRWANDVSRTMAGLAEKRPVTFLNCDNKLIAKMDDTAVPISGSHAYANALLRNGVTDITISAGAKPKEVRDLLDDLTDTEAEALDMLVPDINFVLDPALTARDIFERTIRFTDASMIQVDKPVRKGDSCSWDAVDLPLFEKAEINKVEVYLFGSWLQFLPAKVRREYDPKIIKELRGLAGEERDILKDEKVVKGLSLMLSDAVEQVIRDLGLKS